jgi:DNA-binding response OmpR family regulator
MMDGIVIVHSDEKLAGIYQKHFKNHFSAYTASDGLTALRLIRDIRPKVVLSEHEPPVLSGHALLKFVRSHPELYAIPVIMVANKEADEEALGLGLTEWVNSNKCRVADLVDIVLKHYSNYLKN